MAKKLEVKNLIISFRTNNGSPRTPSPRAARSSTTART